MTDDFAMHTHIQRALPAGFQKRSSLLADLPVLEPRNWGGGEGEGNQSIISNNIDWGDCARAE